MNKCVQCVHCDPDDMIKAAFEAYVKSESYKNIQNQMKKQIFTAFMNGYVCGLPSPSKSGD